MLTPQTILKRAQSKYRDVLRAWLAGEDFAPQEYAVGALSKQLTERRQQIEALRQQSKASLGTGYELVWETVHSRTLGTQTLPRRVMIASLDDYLGLLRKRSEFHHFVADVQQIRQAFPQLEAWMQARPHAIIEYHGTWDDLLLVCAYFVQHPRPEVYIRELPIAVHTKFIEAHQAILSELFDTLLPETAINQQQSTFNGRFGLKDKPTLVRMRTLDAQFERQYTLKIADLQLPLEQLHHVLSEHLKPSYVVIVENLINFLTLPAIPDAVSIFGQGFAVHLLHQIQWLQQCHILYWGDLDVHGFEILSDLRGLFPHTRSVMMDQQTLDTFQAYIKSGVQSRTTRFDHLSAAERQVAHTLVEHHWRLEQEHIPHAYALACFEQLGLIRS